MNQSVLTLAAPVALFLVACTVQSGPVVTTGSADFQWTINNGPDPTVCTLFGAADLHVILQSAGGQPAGEYVAPCSAFAATIDLAAGRYAGTVLLTDSAGAARTTAIQLVPFDIHAGASLGIPLEFPTSAFY